MKFKLIVVISTMLFAVGTLYSSPIRSARSVGSIGAVRISPDSNEQELLYPHLANAHYDTLWYEEPDSLPLFLTLPNHEGFDDLHFNVRFTPINAPFQIFAIHFPLFFIDTGTLSAFWDGEHAGFGEPDLRITIWESGDQDGEPGYPTEPLMEGSIDIDFEDLIFGTQDDSVIFFNIIDVSDMRILINDEIDFHIALDVITDGDDDTLGIYMDDGEWVENSRSGLSIGDDEEFPWVRLQDIEGYSPYNIAIHVVVGEPTPVPDYAENGLDVLRPRTILVNPAYPNPFNQYTTVKINVPHGIYFNARVIDQAGRLIQNISEGIGNGEDYLNIRALNYPAGNYFLQLSTADQNKLVQLIYLK